MIIVVHFHQQPETTTTLAPEPPPAPKNRFDMQLGEAVCGRTCDLEQGSPHYVYSGGDGSYYCDCVSSASETHRPRTRSNVFFSTPELIPVVPEKTTHKDCNKFIDSIKSIDDVDSCFACSHAAGEDGLAPFIPGLQEFWKCRFYSENCGVWGWSIFARVLGRLVDALRNVYPCVQINLEQNSEFG